MSPPEGADTLTNETNLFPNWPQHLHNPIFASTCALLLSSVVLCLFASHHALTAQGFNFVKH